MIKQTIAFISIVVAVVFAVEFASLAFTGKSLLVTKDRENQLHIKWD